MGQWMGARLEGDTETSGSSQTCLGKLETDAGNTAETTEMWAGVL